MTVSVLTDVKPRTMVLSKNIAFLPLVSATSPRVRHHGTQNCARRKLGLEVSNSAFATRKPMGFPPLETAQPHHLARMAVTTDFPALVKRHLGTWEGTYHIIEPKSGATIDRHRCKIEVGIRGERYSQRNTYTWDDGRQEVYEFAGRMIDRELRVESERLEGRVVILGKDALCFLAKRKGIDMELYDVIILLTENTRARGWQVVEGETVTQIIHIEERRTSRDDAYFYMANDPFES